MADSESGDTPMTIQATARPRGWEKRLTAAMRQELASPFDWNLSNCGHLMGAAVRAIHGNGHPILAHLTSGPQDEVMASVAARGGLDNILGKNLQSIPPLMGWDGDLVVVGIGSGDTVGAVLLDGQVCSRTEEGVFRLPITRMKNVRVYRV